MKYNLQKLAPNMVEILLGFLISLFVFISYIKHTISLNYIILILMSILMFYIFKRNKCRYCKNILLIKKSLIFITLFIIWILFQPIIVTDDISRTYSEVRGQLLVPFLYFIVGTFLIILNYKVLTPKRIMNIVFLTGYAHIVIIVLLAINAYFQTAHLPIRRVYILPVDEVSYLTNLVYAMFLAEVYSRILYKTNLLYMSNTIMGISFLIFPFSIYLQGMRWGVITFAVTTISFASFCLYKMKIKIYIKIIIFSLLMLVIANLFNANLKSDRRWATIIETINIVFHDKSLHWINDKKYPCPKLKNGDCVDFSNYGRLAQQINGYKLIYDFPLGIGYSRYAYKNTVNKKFNLENNPGTRNFPHSSILNLLLGVGIPGMILYILFFYFILKVLLKQGHSYYKVFTIFFILAFHTRGLIDTTFMNHNLKVFMLILGIGIFGAITNNKNKEPQ